MEGQFLRSISSQRRGSLLAAGPTQTYKRSTKDSDLCQYGVENALRSIQLHVSIADIAEIRLRLILLFGYLTNKIFFLPFPVSRSISE